MYTEDILTGDILKLQSENFTEEQGELMFFYKTIGKYILWEDYKQKWQKDHGLYLPKMCKCKQCGGIINKDQIFCSLECEEIWKRDHFRWFFKSSSSFCNKHPNERLSYNKCCWSCIKVHQKDGWIEKRKQELTN